MGRAKNSEVETKETEAVKEETADSTNSEVETKEQKTVKTEKKEKEIADDSEIEIVCKNLAGRSVKGIDKIYEFDKNGKSKVTGKDARRFLAIPGYESAE